MKLDKFRLCLQRQSLEWAFLQPSPASTIAGHSVQAAIAPSTWVKLRSLPTTYCSDEALLLCQQSEQQWLAWVPDYGEITLEREEFEL
ncbi:MAG: hypothetical protein KME27_26140 [Lyngbya sp. HA4199-MV5]|jgi:hypothetical protein|nr:hypothetical protein [Lyngbya sp. HA4199-MV5]